MNNMECGKCAYFDGSCCTYDETDRYPEDIVSDCENFELSIYYGG